MSVEIKGGNKLELALKRISTSVSKATSVKIGFLANATYPDGTPVALVAAVNEFGSKDAPPRSFFRTMIAEKSPSWSDAIAQNLVATDYDASTTLARVGEGITGQLQDSIRKLDSPPLKPATVKRKGFDKPLIDSGHMLNSASYEVNS